MDKRKIVVSIEETLYYNHDCVFEVPEDVSDDELIDAFKLAERYGDMDDLMREMERLGCQLIREETIINDYSSPINNDLNIVSFETIKEGE